MTAWNGRLSTKNSSRMITCKVDMICSKWAKNVQIHWYVLAKDTVYILAGKKARSHIWGEA